MVFSCSFDHWMKKLYRWELSYDALETSCPVRERVSDVQDFASLPRRSYFSIVVINLLSGTKQPEAMALVILYLCQGHDT